MIRTNEGNSIQMSVADGAAAPPDGARIHCIVLCKNEGDVIGACLTEARRWAHRIYVYDGESDDDTWSVVTRHADDCIVPWRQKACTFREGLRAEVFNAFRNDARPGDWWLQLNADEFYPNDPRRLLSTITDPFAFVWGINVEYKITWEDLDSIDFSQSFETVRPLLKHYRVDWSEPRAFRHRDGLVWSERNAWPDHVGIAARERLIFTHYPYRSPAQIQSRLDLRRRHRAEGFEGWAHASQADWREKLELAKRCNRDYGSGRFEIDEGKLPSHRDSAVRRTVKRAMFLSGLWR